MGPELTAGFCHQMSELTGLYLGSDGMPLLKATYAEFFFFPLLLRFLFRSNEQRVSVGTWPMSCFCSYSWQTEPPVPYSLSLYPPLSFSLAQAVRLR